MTNVNSVCINSKKKLANLLKEKLCKSITKFIKLFEFYNPDCLAPLFKAVSSSIHEIKLVLLVPFMSRFRGGGSGSPPPPGKFKFL